jgi:hypothetical protein
MAGPGGRCHNRGFGAPDKTFRARDAACRRSVEDSTPGRPLRGEAMQRRHGGFVRYAIEENALIRYMGMRKNAEGASVYIFIVNGLEKEVREHALKQHPGCYEALPASVKSKIAANRAWLSKL